MLPHAFEGIMSGMPPTNDAMHGTPSNCASPNEFGLFSIEDGHIKYLILEDACTYPFHLVVQ